MAAEEARPLRPTGRPLTPEHKATLERSLEELAAAGIDTGDLAAISAAHDDASAEWHRLPGRTQAATPPPTDRFAVAIGEYLCRATDLGWATVVDPLGTDLGLIAERDDFAVIPGNLVTSRWLNGELGWIPGVIGHVVRVRSDAW